MKSILVDSGPLIALFIENDRYHKKAVKFLKAFTGRLATSFAVVTEVALTLDFNVDAQLAFLKWADRAIEIDRDSPRDLPRIVDIMDKYRSLPADFADAALVALAERSNVIDIASIDKDFGIYRLVDGRRFNNVFL